MPAPKCKEWNSGAMCDRLLTMFVSGIEKSHTRLMRILTLCFAAVLLVFCRPVALAGDRLHNKNKQKDAKSQSAQLLKQSEGPVLAPEMLAGPFDIRRRYRSMEGPYVSFKFRIGDFASSKQVELPESSVQYIEGRAVGAIPSMVASMNGAVASTVNHAAGLQHSPGRKRELYWFKGMKLEVVDENGKTMPSAEFICHLNLDVNRDFRNKVFTEGQRCINERIFTITQGQTDMCFPEGFAVPAASDEEWTVLFQAANRSTDQHRRLKHRCTMYFIRDSELVYPVKALSWYVPFGTVVVDKNTAEAEAAEQHHGPACIVSSDGVTAPNSAPLTVFTDPFGRKVAGHWVVPPGINWYHTPLSGNWDQVFASQERKVHFVWTHIHPCCTEVSLVSCGPPANPQEPSVRAPVYTIKSATDTRGKILIEKIETLHSKEGIVLPANQHYELASCYDNTTNQPLDSMVTQGIFFEDNTFARPQWVLAKNQEEVFCGVSPDGACALSQHDTKSEPAASGKLESPYLAQFPRFNEALDGPLLTQAKAVELETSSGALHLVLDPKLAPVHATQIYKLLKSGAYSGTPFVRYEPNFVIQLAMAETKDSGQPNASTQTLNSIRKLPLEVSSQKTGTLSHKKWVLSMAHETGLKDSATTSFSILINDAPHLDHEYTIFGYMVPDAVSLQTIERMAKDWTTSQHHIVKAKDIDLRSADLQQSERINL